MNKKINKKETTLPADKQYMLFLNDIKTRLKAAQLRAALAINSELIKFYWQLGTDLIEKQKTHQWGDHFLQQLSLDMRQAFPEMRGFSVRNLQRIKQFASLYSHTAITTQAVSQLPWGHIVRLIQMVKQENIRQWYVEQTAKNGWSRSILEMQIESNLYERQGITKKKISNYHEHLSATQSDLANEMLKDPYHFDFLTIQEPAQERAIENAKRGSATESGRIGHLCQQI